MKTPDSELARTVLEHVSRENYRPVKPKVIAKQLKIPEDGLRELKKTIKLLVKSGQLAYGPSHLVQRGNAEKKAPELVEGRFKRTSRGFGFLIPTPTGDGRINEDIYIGVEDTSDAADGDTVAVKVLRRRGQYGKRCGRIVEIVERRATNFVGTYRVNGDFGIVHVDGGQFTEPVVVGDSTAKGCKPGDKVVIEMLRFPSPRVDGQGVVIEVLGPRNKPGVDTMTVMREFSLPEKFPENVLEAARDEAAEFDESIPENRLDLTADTIITIDPFDARDFDDAISLKRIENDHWLLGVHIADVSHFVRPNSAIDNEAYSRATSVYLPDRVVPMIPELISNGLASLQPDRVRYARTAFIEFTPDGKRVGVEVRRSAIKSCRRFTYEEVDEFLADREAFQDKVTPEVFGLLGRMHELAMMLRKRRNDGGSIELGLPEVKIDLDADGKVTGAHTVEHTESHQIIEEFMLAANMAVAESIADRELFLLRRIHPIPTPRKLKDLTRFVRGVGIECRSLESRFEIKRVLAEVAGEPIERAINLATLKSMQKAIYSPREEGHYALNADFYCHFTSPIRRYPDLVIHRMMDAIEDGNRPASEFGHMTRLGHHCSIQEQNAEKAERELIKLKLINFLVERIGTEMVGSITGVEPYGVFVQGKELPAEGLVLLEELGPDTYDHDSDTQTLTGRRSGECFRLGDEILVKVMVADPDRRVVEFSRVLHGGGMKRSSGRGGAKGPGKRPARGKGTKGKSRLSSKSVKKKSRGGKKKSKRKKKRRK